MKRDKVHAVITGGGSGMGKATAEALIAAGGKVCIVDFNKERCEEVVAALGPNSYWELPTFRTLKGPRKSSAARLKSSDTSTS
jgi:NAD(P)-dependent dehydrogenase (short-subunit alcohol dehydrogenase family)